MNLKEPVARWIKGVGPKKEEALKTLGIESVFDLITTFPFRYEDISSRSIHELVDGEKTTLTGTVISEAVVQYYGSRRNKLSFRIVSENVNVIVSFFNQHYLKQKVVVGETIAVFGKWDAKKQSLTGMKILFSGESKGLDDFEPVYHVNKNIKQSELVKYIRSAFELGAKDFIEENLPTTLLKKYRLLPRNEAVVAMHFPKNNQEHLEAVRRLKFEELLYFQMKIQGLRHQEKELSKGVEILYDVEKLKSFTKKLPFELTNAQKRVTNEIVRDMRSKSHMIRLLQGDVGSGKTVIAAIAMFACATANKQSAIMVPTEILAIQHLESLQSLLGGEDVKIAILTGSNTAKEREVILKDLKSGAIDILVGTHALIQEGVDFHDLSLVITDEQHRFGVNQRKALRNKGENPDILFMTATPIPRTLAISAFGEMDVSTIDEMPAGRIPIQTSWIKHEQMDQLLQWLETELTAGNQAYFISPLIEESEMMDLQDATRLKDDLSEHFQERFKVDLLHGKMKNDEKDDIMQHFKEKHTDILVSTTVIEVGVNVPNATVMVIIDADRFGLSQLHQLRGRVGRGDKKSYCILVANPKTEYGKERMKIMTQTNNGFILSQKDLELRGAGELFGTKQSGLPEFAVANLVEDANILEEARQVASGIWQTPNWQEKEEWKEISVHFEDYLEKQTFD